MLGKLALTFRSLVLCAFACGLAANGFSRGDRLALVGDNRPRLYWAMAAAFWFAAPTASLASPPSRQAIPGKTASLSQMSHRADSAMPASFWV